ncbi:MAG: SurA N-terminal domain-containing protein [Burkholderiaceae bacterium]
MFEFIRGHGKILQFLLLILIFPAFAFFGLSGYDRFFRGDDDVAKVGELSISAQEFENARQGQLDNMRRILGDQVDAAMFDTPAARRQILEGLVDQRLLAVTAQENRLTVSDDVVREAIQEIPGVKLEDGSFDFGRYQTLLAAQGLTEAQFEGGIRADLSLQLLPQSITESAFIPTTVAGRLARLNREKRTVKVKQFKPEDYISKVDISAEAGRDYYDKNPQEFQSPEAMKINYLILSEKALADEISLTDDEVTAYYEENQSLFGQRAQRRASHILIEAGESASEADKNTARSKAQGLLERLRSGEDFAEIAKAESGDPGSATNGGDLGYFDQDTMTKAFADVAFALEADQISDVVETEFGFHIIKVTEIRPKSVKPLTEVKAEIETTLRQQKAREAYLDASDAFSNTVYEEPDSLGPTAEKTGLTIQTLDEYRRFGTPNLAADSPLASRKVVAALFNEATIKSGMNTEAIDAGNNTLVAARIIEHRPAKLLPYEAVQAQAESIVRARQASALAKAAGEERLAALQGGAEPAGFGDEKIVSRASGGMPADAMAKVFGVSASSVPAFIGHSSSTGAYEVIEVLKVEALPETELSAAVEATSSELVPQAGQQTFQAYLTSLKARSEIERYESRILADQGDTAAAQ